MFAGLPRTCSGDMYATAPNTTPAPICEATVGASTLAKSPSGRVNFAHTEVEDFDAPVAGKKNVFRLEVAVEDAFIMCCNQPPNNLERVICRSAGGHRTRLNPLAKRLVFQKLRH